MFSSTPQRMRGNARTPALIILASVAMAAGVWLASTLQQGSSDKVMEIEGGTVRPVARALPAFSLTDQDGNRFDQSRLRDKWSFVFFGYTFCPDICPTTLNTFKQVRALLAASTGGLEDVQFVFVSVDPNRDTPERLKEYVRFFSPDFLGATGEPAELDKLVQGSGAIYVVVPEGKDQEYLVDHSAGVFLMNPDGAFKAYFRAPHDPQIVANGFTKVRDARR